MYCKHCGKEISETAKFCDGCGKPVSEEAVQVTTAIVEEPKKKKKKKHPILATFLILFSFFIIIGAIGGSDEPKKVETSAPAVTQAVVEETTAPPVFTVGDTLEMGGILVTLNDVSENHGSQFMKPTEGNIFVTCEFTIENNTESEMAVSSLMSFECYFDDYSASLSIGALMADQSKKQLDGSVAPGKKISGVVGYEAPADWSDMAIHFKSNVYSSKPFVFNYGK